jgi:hypothetical protein
MINFVLGLNVASFNSKLINSPEAIVIIDDLGPNALLTLLAIQPVVEAMPK